MKIKKCRSCNSKKLTHIISLGKQYLSDFPGINKKPKSFPLTVVLCKQCMLLQLAHTTPSKYLYTERYGYKSGINKTMQAELKEIANKSLGLIKKSKNRLIAVDIGANDGTLLKYYPKNVFKIGVEPIKKLAKECKIYADAVVTDFFNHKAVNLVLKEKKADIVTAISCFYDMENPNEFVDDVTKILKEDGILVIQQNYLVGMLEQNAFDNIVHEHLEYYSLMSLNHLLNRHGLEVVDLELRSLNGGSFRTYIAFKNKREISNSVKKLLAKELVMELHKKIVYKAFAKRVEDNKKNLYNFIKKEVKNGKVIYVYGASTRGNTLLQYFGLNNKLIKYAVERNPEKWGKIIASVGIPIISEEQARKDKPDYMLVLPWFFKEEFLEREKKYLENGGHFIFPLPKFEII